MVRGADTWGGGRIVRAIEGRPASDVFETAAGHHDFLLKLLTG